MSESTSAKFQETWQGWIQPSTMVLFFVLVANLIVAVGSSLAPSQPLDAGWFLVLSLWQCLSAGPSSVLIH